MKTKKERGKKKKKVNLSKTKSNLGTCAIQKDSFCRDESKNTWAIFVSRKVIFGKPLSKLSCVCLPLRKVINEKYFPTNGKHFPVKEKHFPVNEKHFPVKEKHFPVNEKHFPVKEKFYLVSRKVFSLLAVFVFRKVVSEKPLSKLSCVCLPLGKLVIGKHFPVKGKFGLVFRKVFS
jgi:hypothetical protein